MRTSLCCLSLAVALLVPQRGFGCTIPVYRYALERWDLGLYELCVFHRGRVPGELARWQHGANLEVRTIDLDGKVEPALAKLWKQQGSPATLPWLVLRLPGADPEQPPAWTGPCTAANLAALVDSPLRQRLVAALSQGETAVFVLLGSRNRAADAAAHKVVADELRQLEKRLKLPEQSKDGPQLRLPLPLQV